MKIQIITIITGLLLGSIAYDFNIDNEKVMGLPSYQISWIGMSLGALIGSFLISIFNKQRIAKVAILLFAGIILSIIGRMVYDRFFTSKTHNLAPLEIIVYSIITIPAAFSGAYLGQFVHSRHKKF